MCLVPARSGVSTPQAVLQSSPSGASRPGSRRAAFETAGATLLSSDTGTVSRRATDASDCPPASGARAPARARAGDCMRSVADSVTGSRGRSAAPPTPSIAHAQAGPPGPVGLPSSTIPSLSGATAPQPCQARMDQARMRPTTGTDSGTP
jgi:hypothetical protein